jgi:HPt (histidine-containing phosphotransfer) domain-containing protein
MQSVQSLQPVYSIYGSDPDLSELVAIFAHELPRRLETLRSHAEVADWESVARVAHQLNELGSNYGFAKLSTLAARLEHCCTADHSAGETLKALDRLGEHCECVRPGSAE